MSVRDGESLSDLRADANRLDRDSGPFFSPERLSGRTFDFVLWTVAASACTASKTS